MFVRYEFFSEYFSDGRTWYSFNYIISHDKIIQYKFKIFIVTPYCGRALSTTVFLLM